MSSFSESNSQSDKEYLIAVKSEYILLQQKYRKVADELKKWETRVGLAEQNGKFDLKLEAQSRVEMLHNDIRGLIGELTTLKTEVEKAVKTVRESPEILSINPNKLLADLENLIGNSSEMELESNIKGIELENELEKLKNEMES